VRQPAFDAAEVGQKHHGFVNLRFEIAVPGGDNNVIVGLRDAQAGFPVDLDVRCACRCHSTEEITQ
jgi:hypothetical protein